ncbi:MAG: hypothetical protein CL484_03170 [Acidobacteria bacterium]|nr:hypothetical protein [Acidobacteriota bacterium]
MNNSALIFLINDDVRAVRCSYEPLRAAATDLEIDANTYVFKTMDPDLQVGDYVVIPTDTRHRHTVVKVEAVDIELDFDTDIQLKWIIDRVDDTAYQSVLAEEQKAITAIQTAERKRKRRELRESLLGAQAEELEALSLANHSETKEG